MAISNVVELRKVVAEQETASLHDVAKAINIKLRLADQNENDAANHRREAGEMLVTLKDRVENDNQSWKQFVYDYFDRPRSEIEQLMKRVSANKHVTDGLEANPEFAAMSDRRVAKKLGVSHPTVAAARKATGKNLPVENGLAQPAAKRVGEDGKARKMPAPKQRDQSSPKQAKPKPASDPPSTLIEQALRIVAKMTAAQRQTFLSKVKETYK